MNATPSRMPAVFLGHGNPMNALQQNRYTEAWRRLGKELPRPRGIVCISAHWYMPGSAVTAMDRPRTIHDFGGFPQALFEVQYPALGDPELAAEVKRLLQPIDVSMDYDWGLDHGAWSVLCHVFPDAGIPVVQLRIDETLSAESHYKIGAQLSALRENNVLILGSGNLVHNLHTYAWGRHVREPYDWAIRFEEQAKASMQAGEHASLIGYEALGRDALLAVPTPEHYLPLLYVLGAQRPNESVTFLVEGVDGGSVSMLSVRVG